MTRQLDATIIDRLRHRGPATPTEVATAIGAHPLSVRRRCDALEREGRLRVTTGGVYTVARGAGTSSPAASD